MSFVWKPSDVVEASFEREEGHAFMRWSRTFVLGRQKVQLGLDFMEGQVRGRAGEAFTIDDRFLADSRLETLKVGVQECRLFVPSYADFFVLKAASARRGDVRDIAALVWKNGVPDVRHSLKNVNDSALFMRNLERKIIPEVEHANFLNSWKGMFVTSEFTDQDRRNVVAELRGLVESNQRR